MRLEIKLAIFFALMVTPNILIAQTTTGYKLLLKGDAANCLAGEVEDPELSCYKLRMTYKNAGIIPLIIINPNLGYGTGLKEATFYFSYSEFDQELGRIVGRTPTRTVSIHIDAAKKENFKSMARFFDGERPPENMTIILQPGETYVFDHKLEIKSPYVMTAPFVMRWKDSDGKMRTNTSESERVSASSFTLTYEFSFLSLLPDPDLLEKLQARWRQYGYLPIGLNGTFIITSEKMREINGFRVHEDERKEELKKMKPAVK